MLRDDEEDVRHAALSTLRDPVDLLEPHIGTLVAHAERCREDLRDVMHVLSEIGPTATLVALRSPVEEVRELAADWAEAEDPVVRARLVELLADEAPEVAAEAFTALSRLDEPPPEVVQRAAAVLAAPWPAEASGDMGAWMRESNRRTAAVRIAEEQIRQGAASVRALLPSLADQSDRVRGTAACAIVRSAPAAELSRVLDAVRPLWHDDGLALDVRFSIALEVGARQGAGTEVVPWLASYAERGDVRRVEALEALGRIADPRAATVLLGQLDVVIWDVRVSAVAALGGHVGSDSRVAAALIEQLQAAPRAEVRAAAATALKRVRERTDVRAALLAARSDPADSVRNAVAAALRD
jgi:HEAT repeat protein